MASGRWTRWACAAATASLLAACGTPRGVLLPVAETAPGTSRVDMLVATTRLAATPAEMYSGERGPELGYAGLSISLPPDAIRQPGTVQWPRRLPGNPATDFVALRADPLDRPGATAWFNRAVKRVPGRQVLVFVHGFNNRFEDAVFRFAQIVHDSRAEVVPVLFTWPSRGSVLAYGYDRESTNYSRNALETVLRTLARDPQVGEITVLAHSMGNWLTLESLRQMAIRDGRVAPKIRNVLLAAPDVDVDLAREAIRDMGPKRPELTLFLSEDDRALAVSRVLWGDSVRLGAIDPDQEPYRGILERDAIRVVNLTRLKGGDPLNHAKFAGSPQLVQLLGNRLADGQTITDSRVGIGDRIVQATAGAASAVGTAAALAVSAPIAVIDPETRDNYGGQFESFGRGLAETVGSAADLATAPARRVLRPAGQ